MAYNPKSKLNLRPFVKDDPRINRAGVPPDKIAARRFVENVGAELLRLPAKDGARAEEMTRYYAMIRSMYSSRNPKHHEMLLEMMGHYQKNLDLTSGGEKLQIEIVKASHEKDEDKNQ